MSDTNTLVTVVATGDPKAGEWIHAGAPVEKGQRVELYADQAARVIAAGLATKA